MEERIECLTEILEEIGIEATYSQVKQIAEDFALHIEMEREMASYGHTSLSPAKCGECEKLRNELKNSERQINIYNDFIKRDKKASFVYINGNEVHGQY